MFCKFPDDVVLACTDNNGFFDNLKDRLLSIEELAALLNVSPSAVRDWVYRKKNIPYIKVGRLVRFHLSAVEKWLSERSHNVD